MKTSRKIIIVVVAVLVYIKLKLDAASGRISKKDGMKHG